MAAQTIIKRAARLRQQLVDEMITLAADDTLFLRRLRMLSQLSELEAQALGKLKNFDTERREDILDGMHRVLSELALCVDRNG